MRGKLLIFFLGLSLIAAYVAAPFYTAWSIREAIRNGDAAYLEARIDWPRVKDTLRVSMAEYALGPGATAQADVGGATPAAPRPGLWQRIKTAYGQRVVASMVDNMVTPAGLTKLLSYRQSFNEKVRGIADERKTLTLRERVAKVWSRVIRAEFLTPTRFAMEMRDKAIAERSYAGILELQGTTWRLVHLEIKRSGKEAVPATVDGTSSNPLPTTGATGAAAVLASSAATPLATAPAGPVKRLWARLKQGAQTR